MLELFCSTEWVRYVGLTAVDLTEETLIFKFRQ